MGLWGSFDQWHREYCVAFVHRSFVYEKNQCQLYLAYNISTLPIVCVSSEREYKDMRQLTEMKCQLSN